MSVVLITARESLMRICFVGNINNMPLLYARAIRALGHDVELFVDAQVDDSLHRPEARYGEYSDSASWIRHTPVRNQAMSHAFPKLLRRSLINEVRSLRPDGIVLNGLNVGLANFFSEWPCYALLAGADADVYLDPSASAVKPLIERYGWVAGLARSAALRRVVSFQRQGLRRCSGFNYFPEGINPIGDRLIRDVYEGRSPARLQIRGTDCAQVKLSPSSQRLGAQTRIFAPARHLWLKPLPVGYNETEAKGNDLIVRALAQFRDKLGYCPEVTFVEKGPHVANTKVLIAEARLEENVRWLTEMTQAALFERYCEADIVFDQLASHWVGAIGLDAMLTGRPVIANGRPEIIRKYTRSDSPICQASSVEDIVTWLETLCNSPEKRREIGFRSAEYVRENFNSFETGRAIVRFFQAAGGQAIWD